MVTTKLEKKQKGIFYTPDVLAKILCEWAITDKHNTVLEPSFGGCGFIKAAISRLYELECAIPENQICGCDIDEGAFMHLNKIPAFNSDAFLKGDFLQVQPSAFPLSPVDIVIGNPPYISYHNMSPEQRVSMRLASFKGITLPSTSSLWGHFIIHSLNFIKEDGKLAFILPSSFLYTDYATKVHALIQKHFKRSIAISLSERIFLDEGTDEKIVVLLCSGFSESTNGQIQFDHIDNLEDMANIIHLWAQDKWVGKDFSNKIHLLSSQYDFSLFNDINNTENISLLGYFLQVKIGIVTGDNNFFILNKSKSNTLNIPDKYLTPILSKFPNLGIHLTNEDIQSFISSDFRCLLVDTSNNDDIDSDIQLFLESYPKDQENWPKTFKKRPIWHRSNDRNIPDAFFPYMHNSGPLLLLNNANVICTNTIHRIYFTITDSTLIKLICISILTTFSQISAEIEGRSYGSGVLKHEPSELVKIKINVPLSTTPENVSKTFDGIDQLIRNGQREEAQLLADSFIFPRITQSEGYSRLQDLLRSLRALRK